MPAPSDLWFSSSTVFQWPSITFFSLFWFRLVHSHHQIKPYLLGVLGGPTLDRILDPLGLACFVLWMLGPDAVVEQDHGGAGVLDWTACSAAKRELAPGWRGVITPLDPLSQVVHHGLGWPSQMSWCGLHRRRGGQ